MAYPGGHESRLFSQLKVVMFRSQRITWMAESPQMQRPAFTSPDKRAAKACEAISEETETDTYNLQWLTDWILHSHTLASVDSKGKRRKQNCTKKPRGLIRPVWRNLAFHWLFFWTKSHRRRGVALFSRCGNESHDVCFSHPSALERSRLT